MKPDPATLHVPFVAALEKLIRDYPATSPEMKAEALLQAARTLTQNRPILPNQRGGTT